MILALAKKTDLDSIIDLINNMKDPFPYQIPYLEVSRSMRMKSGSQDLASIDLGSHETLTDISPYVKVVKIVGLVKPEPGETRSAPARLTHRCDPCSTEDSALPAAE
jgi:hypothetical protein